MTEQQMIDGLDLEAAGTPIGAHATIIPFAPYLKRRERYEELREAYVAGLEESAEELYNRAINLATNGAWAALGEKQAEGTVFEFTPEMLFDCSDNRVKRIMGLWEHIMNVLWDEEVGANP